MENREILEYIRKAIKTNINNKDNEVNVVDNDNNLIGVFLINENKLIVNKPISYYIDNIKVGGLN